MTEPQDEKTLRLLLRAEFAEFKVQFFNELQAKLDGKADRLPFELLAKDVAELKASAAARKHLETDFADVGTRVEKLELSDARRGGAWYVGRALAGWVLAFAIAATNVVLNIIR